MSTRLEAHYDDRVYYFTVLEQLPEKITIVMYKATYVFVKSDSKWSNDTNNQLHMVDGLIASVVNTIGQ